MDAEEISVPKGGCAERWGALSLGGGEYTIPSHKSFKKTLKSLDLKRSGTGRREKKSERARLDYYAAVVVGAFLRDS